MPELKNFSKQYADAYLFEVEVIKQLITNGHKLLHHRLKTILAELDVLTVNQSGTYCMWEIKSSYPLDFYASSQYRRLVRLQGHFLEQELDVELILVYLNQQKLSFEIIES